MIDPDRPLARHLLAPVDAAGPVAMRVLFGLVMCGAMVRFLVNGDARALFVEPTFFFKYLGFEWVQPLPDPWLSAFVLGLAALALGVALGIRSRACAVLFALGFAYLELNDVTTYLNHYYLVVLLAVVLAVAPVHRPGVQTVPRWALYLLRFQVGVVYFNAGLAKLGPDWLLHAQPLSIWLSARTEMPIIGPLLGEPWVAFAASWAAFLYDTTIVLWLSLRRTRPFAYAVLCAFHLFTGLSFDIGIFPVLMTLSALIFFPPDWPRRWLRRPVPAPVLFPAPSPPGRAVRVLLPLGIAWCAFHVLFPLRHLAYPGDVLWNEQGMRFAWKVLVREKNGSVAFRVRDPASGRQWQVNAARYLTPRQESDMAGQPDLVLQLAHHVGQQMEARLSRPVEVRVDAWVSLNGRPAARLIDPEVDLMQVEDGLGVARWILPGPAGPPLDPFAARPQARASR
jgi:hypothetical protein